MDFGLTDEQQQYLKSLREFLAAEITPHAAEMDRTESFRRDNLTALAQIRLHRIELSRSIRRNGRGLAHNDNGFD